MTEVHGQPVTTDASQAVDSVPAEDGTAVATPVTTDARQAAEPVVVLEDTNAVE